MTRNWPLLTDEAKRLRREIEERAWTGQPTDAQERALARVRSAIANGEQYVVPF